MMCLFNSVQIPVPSQVRSLEEEVVQLKQELKTSEVNREELSIELMKYRQTKVESSVRLYMNVCICT